MTDWHPHDGGNQPVPDAMPVIVRFRNGRISGPRDARVWRWRNWPARIGQTDHDIVAWRVAARDTTR